MKKITLVLMILSTLIYAQIAAPKMGCILSQQGEVTANWTIYSRTKKLGIQGDFTNIKYNPIAKEGYNFKAILVGTRISMDTNSAHFQNKELVATIKHIQSKLRIKRGPRHGVIVFDISLNGVTREMPMVYYYEAGDMQIKGFISLRDFKLSKENAYTELSINLSINSIVCAIPHKK